MTSVDASPLAATPRLSPPPKSRALSSAAAVFALVLVLAVAALGAAAMNGSEEGTTPPYAIGWLLSTVGVLLAGGAVLWIAVRSLRRSLRASKEVSEGGFSTPGRAVHRRCMMQRSPSVLALPSL